MRATAALTAACMGILAPTLAFAQGQTITVQGTGSTFVINFNAGYTADRANALERAAQVWADTVRSSVDIEVDISFQVLTCSANSAVLGSAGATTAARDFPNAPASNTWYPIGLANALSGTDRNGSSAEIQATFNSAIDDPARDQSCLTGVDWYYGTGAPPNGTIGFFDVVLHELAHGLGFFSYANLSTGGLLMGRDDHYTRQLEDNSTGKKLDSATANDSERQTAFTDDGDLIWTGSEVNGLSSNLTAGALSSGEVLVYAPGTLRSGSSVSHFDTRLAPNELMEPSYTNQPDRDLTVALFRDIGWDAPNVAPVVTGLSGSLSTPEDTPIQLQLSDFTVTDPDNVYPTDFTLTVQSGTNYTVNGTTVTPSLDFDGDLFVPITVNDGVQDSATFTATVSIIPVNDPPEVTGSGTLTVAEDQDLTLQLSDFEVSDPDDAYPTGFSFRIGNGSDFTVIGDDTVRPDANFNGGLSVPLIVSDGALESPVFILDVTVNAVNDAPVISAQQVLRTNEDQPITLTPADFTITDVEDSTFTVRAIGGPNHSVSGATVSAAPNFFGTLTVPVVASDGQDEGDAFDVEIIVDPVNDIPIVSGQATLSTPEETPISLSLADLTVVDPDDTQFSLRIGAGANYSVTGDAVMPDVDFNGVLSVPVTVNDGEADSDPFELQIQVTPVNDRPVLTSGPASLRTNEDEPITLDVAAFTVADPDDDFPADFTLQIDASNNYTAAGNVVTPDAHYFGPLEVVVRVSDRQSVSDPLTLQIEVDPVNDAPVISGPSELTVDEDGDLELSVATLDVDDVDDDEADLTLEVRPGPDYTVNATTVIPDGDFDGTLTVAVVVSDPETDSEPFEIEVDVLPIPDRPVVTGQQPLVTMEDEALALALGDFLIDDPDSTDLTLQVLPGPNFTVQSSTVTPSPDFDGTLEVPVFVSDGELQSDPFLARIEVTPVNDPPRIVGQQIVSGARDQDLTLTTGMLQIEDPDDRMFDLQVQDGPGYTRSGTTIRPTETGVLTVSVTVSDAEFTSEAFPLQVSVGRAELTVPVVVDATGLYTRVSPPPPPQSLGVLEGPVEVDLADGPSGWLRPGRYALVWRERSAGEEARVSQPLWVRPIISLSPNRTVSEGAPGRFAIVSNGPLPSPVGVDVAVAGSAGPEDHDLIFQRVDFVQGDTLREVGFTTVTDASAEGEERIDVTLAGDINLQAGAAYSCILSEGAVAPDFEVTVDVAGEPSTTLVRGGAPVELQVRPLDGTMPRITWTFPEGAQVQGQGLRRSLAAEGPVGPVSVSVRAESDDGAVSVRRVDLRMVASAPALGDADTDADGTRDLDEGYGDQDLDGLPDHLDAWSIPHVLPLRLADTPVPVVESDPGVRLRLGPLALQSGADGAGLVPADLEASGVALDDRRLDGLVDVSATELSSAGQRVRFVMVLPDGLPDDAGVRLYDGARWRDFVSNENSFASAPSVDGTCPPPFDPSYGPATGGHGCLRIEIEDGGPNDLDGAADRSIRLVAGVGVAPLEDRPGPGSGATGGGTLNQETGGCRCTESVGLPWAAMLLLGLLGIGIRRFRAPVRSVVVATRTGRRRR